MINILNKKLDKRPKSRAIIDFDGSYINKFDLALKNLELVVQEDNSFNQLKRKRA
jgi:hypothetical protein